MGNTSSPGTSVSALRSDAQFTVQGMENSGSDPASGNFVGREYFNTVTLAKRLCIATAGSGTWVSAGNVAAADLVVHAAQHKDGGHDPLADNTLTDHMFAAKTNIFSASLASDSGNFSGTTWTNIQDLTTVATTTAQTLCVSVSLCLTSADSTGRNAQFRVLDVTASNTTIYKSVVVQVDHTTQTPLTGVFFYTTPIAGGTRTFRVQGTCSVAGQVKAVGDQSVNTEAVNTPTIQAVIL
jgi:hypothetical protein